MNQERPWILQGNSGSGVKIGYGSITPDYGWHDMVGNVTVRFAGATAPALAVYRGGIQQYQFAVNDECFNEFHILHDYAPGSHLYLHTHWSHIATTVTGGSVTWGFEVTYAKGHNQAAFAAPVTRTVVGNASTTQYQHIITETQISAASPDATQIDSDDIQVDGILLIRTYLSANNITVSGGGVPDPFLHFTDIHYQSTAMPTKNKAPSFYI